MMYISYFKNYFWSSRSYFNIFLLQLNDSYGFLLSPGRTVYHFEGKIVGQKLLRPVLELLRPQDLELELSYEYMSFARQSTVFILEKVFMLWNNRRIRNSECNKNNPNVLSIFISLKLESSISKQPKWVTARQWYRWKIVHRSFSAVPMLRFSSFWLPRYSRS